MNLVSLETAKKGRHETANAFPHVSVCLWEIHFCKTKQYKGLE